MTLNNIEEYSLRLNTIMDCTTNLQLERKVFAVCHAASESAQERSWVSYKSLQ